MSATIWKFPLVFNEWQQIRMPVNAHILCAQMQNGQPMLWAIVEDNVAGTELVNVMIYGTGHDLPPQLPPYVGTVQQDGFVWHIFAGPKP